MGGYIGVKIGYLGRDTISTLFSIVIYIDRKKGIPYSL
jgi:hypothetical protein